MNSISTKDTYQNIPFMNYFCSSPLFKTAAKAFVFCVLILFGLFAKAQDINVSSIAATPSSATGGAAFTVDAVFGNLGAGSASSIPFTIQLPTSIYVGSTNLLVDSCTVVVAGTTSPATACPVIASLTVDEATDRVTGVIPAIAQGGSIRITVKGNLPGVAIAAAGTALTSVSASASVTVPSGVTDSNLSNNSRTANIGMTYASTSNVAIASNNAGPVQINNIGDSVTVRHTMTYTNTGTGYLDGSRISLEGTAGSSGLFGFSGAFVSCTASGDAQCPADALFPNKAATVAAPFTIYGHPNSGISLYVPRLAPGASITVVYDDGVVNNSCTASKAAIHRVTLTPPGNVTVTGTLQSQASLTINTTCPSSNVKVIQTDITSGGTSTTTGTNTQAAMTTFNNAWVWDADNTFTATYRYRVENNSSFSVANNVSIRQVFNNMNYVVQSVQISPVSACTATGGAVCPTLWAGGTRTITLGDVNTIIQFSTGNIAFGYSTPIPDMPANSAIEFEYSVKYTRYAVCGAKSTASLNAGVQIQVANFTNVTTSPVSHNATYSNAPGQALCPQADLATSITDLTSPQDWSNNSERRIQLSYTNNGPENLTFTSNFNTSTSASNSLVAYINGGTPFGISSWQNGTIMLADKTLESCEVLDAGGSVLRSCGWVSPASSSVLFTNAGGQVLNSGETIRAVVRAKVRTRDASVKNGCWSNDSTAWFVSQADVPLGYGDNTTTTNNLVTTQTASPFKPTCGDVSFLNGAVTYSNPAPSGNGYAGGDVTYRFDVANGSVGTPAVRNVPVLLVLTNGAAFQSASCVVQTGTATLPTSYPVTNSNPAEFVIPSINKSSVVRCTIQGKLPTDVGTFTTSARSYEDGSGYADNNTNGGTLNASVTDTALTYDRYNQLDLTIQADPVMVVTNDSNAASPAPAYTSGVVMNLLSNDSTHGQASSDLTTAIYLSSTANDSVIGNYTIKLTAPTTRELAYGVLINPNGTVTSSASSPAGTYRYKYLIGDTYTASGPFKSQTVSDITVVLTSDLGVNADNNTNTLPAGFAAVAIANVIDNDKINNQTVVLGGVSPNGVIASSGIWPVGFSLDSSTGQVTMSSVVAPGVYTMDYSLCDIPGVAVPGVYEPPVQQCKTASITITADAPTPVLSKAFASSILKNGETSLTFTVSNSASFAIAQTGIAFKDTLPANIKIAATPNASHNCTAATISAVAGAGLIEVTGLGVGASSSCTVTVNVSSDTAQSDQEQSDCSANNASAPSAWVNTLNSSTNAADFTNITANTSACLTVSDPARIQLVMVNSGQTAATFTVDLTDLGLTPATGTEAFSNVASGATQNGALTFVANKTATPTVAQLALTGWITESIVCRDGAAVFAQTTANSFSSSLTLPALVAGQNIVCTVTARQAPEIVTTKSADKSGARDIGEEVTYTLTSIVSNGATTTGYRLSDTPGAGLAFVAGSITSSNPSMVCDFGVTTSGVLTCNLASAAVPATYTVSYKMKIGATPVSATSNANVDNKVLEDATLNGGDSTRSCITGTETNCVVNLSVRLLDLGITITDGLTKYVPNQPLTYTVEVTNSSDVAVINSIFTLPANSKFTDAAISCTPTGAAVCPAAPALTVALMQGSGIVIPSIPANGGKLTFTISGTSSAAATGDLTRTASIVLPVGLIDTDTANNSAADTDTAGAPKLELTKEANKATTSAAGEVILYTFKVKNTGDVPLSTITLTDSMLLTENAGFACTEITTLAVGAEQTFACTSAQYVVKQVDIDLNGGGDGSIENIATATAKDHGNNTLSDQDDAKVAVPPATCPAVSVSKTANKTEVTAVGETIVYSFKVANPCNTTLNDVVLSDPLLSTLSCTEIDGLIPGAEQTVSCSGGNTYTVTQQDIDNRGNNPVGNSNYGKLSNTVTVTAKTAEATPVTLSDIDSFHITMPQPTYSQTMVKERTGWTDNNSDGVISQGDTLTYTITASNTGAGSVSITLDDSKTTPSQQVCAAVAPTATCVLTGAYTVTAADALAGVVENTATSSGTACPTIATAGCSASKSVNVATVNITSAKTASPSNASTVTVGTTITYTLAAKVQDAATTSEFKLVDTLGAGLTFGGFTSGTTTSSPNAGTYNCSVASGVITCLLPSGAVQGDYEVTYTATVNNAATTATLGNSVTPSGGGASTQKCAGTPLTDPPCKTAHTMAAPVIVSNKTSNPVSSATVKAGDTITYTLTAVVSEGATTEPLVLTDSLGAGLQFGALTTPAVGSCTTGQTIVCTLPSATVPGTYTFVYTATVSNSATTATLGNSVTPSGGGASTQKCAGTPLTDPPCKTTHTMAAPVIITNKAANPASGSTVKVGDTITYTLTAVVSEGATTAPLVLTDSLGAGLQFGALTTPAVGSCTTGQTIVCTLPSATVPGTYTFVYTATVSNSATTATLGNSVTPSGGGASTQKCAGTPLTDPPCKTTHILITAKLKLIKALGAPVMVVGMANSYILTVTNNGDAITSVDSVMTDEVPAGLTVGTVAITGAPAGSSCAVAAQRVTCTIKQGLSYIAPNNVATITIAVTPTPAAGATVTNTAKVNGGGDPNCQVGSTDANCSGTAVGQVLRLTSTKTVADLGFPNRVPPVSPDGFASPGEQLRYTISANNGTPVSMPNVTVRDTIPQNTAYVENSLKCSIADAVPSLPTAANGGQVSCTLASLAANTVLTMTFDVLVGRNLSSGATHIVNDKWCAGSHQSCEAGVPNKIEIKRVTKVTILKTANKSVAEVGDLLKYTITMKNEGDSSVDVDIVDTLPQGFRYVTDTTRLNEQVRPNPDGAPGATLTFKTGVLPYEATATLTYYVRLGVGSQLGDGINSAFARDEFAKTVSETAYWQVTVTKGVFTDQTCLLGKVFIDANRNGVQDKGEFSLPAVRLYLSDGTNIVTDDRGRYSICDVAPRSHAMAIDKTTLPALCSPVPTSNLNLGDPTRLLLDMKNGVLARGDFACAFPLPPEPKAKPLEYKRINIAAEALFMFDKFEVKDILPGGIEKLRELADTLKQAQGLEKVDLIGHTDRLGTATHNQTLSERRAQTIKAVLVEWGVPAEKVYTQGKGLTVPLHLCEGVTKRKDLITCLQPNRRVEVGIAAEFLDEEIR